MLKKVLAVIGTSMLSINLLTACGPALTDKFEEIGTNETVFVIPLEDIANQKQVFSVKFLNEKKVYSNRIYLPQRKITTGRLWFNYKWVPTVKIVRIDRRPIRLIWQENAGIKVESRDSIGFTVGVDITAHIEEQNSALFLYNYPSGNLKNTLGDAVKSKATEILSREFAKHNLEGTQAVYDAKGILITPAKEGAREKKGEIVDLAKKELINYFANLGVTIDTFGLVGGLWYEDNAIQNAINANFESALERENELNKRKAQEETNAKELSIAVTAREKADEFAKAEEAQTKMVKIEILKMQAQADLNRSFADLKKAEHWNGKLPEKMMPANSGFIINTD